jgi:hypothetical protein
MHFALLLLANIQMRIKLDIFFLLGSVTSTPPVQSDQILPPTNYGKALQQPKSSTTASGEVTTADTIASPTVDDLNGPTVVSLSAKMYQSSAIDSGSNSQVADPSSGGQSITAQAVVDGMDLQTCAAQVRFTNQQYTVFDNSLSGISAQISDSELRLQSIDVITHNILTDEANFSKQIDRLQELFNTLAVRANSLGSWMSDEKTVRDSLQELYKQMVVKTTEVEQSLSVLSAHLKTALQRLSNIERQSSKVLSAVASAQNGMYAWAANVTVSVNSHTTKLESLKQSMQYRVSQIDTTIPEMANIAKRTMYIARSFHETNLAYAASNVLSQVESVLQPPHTSDTLMSIPSSSR